jgi:hypothetical protein
VGRTLFEDAAQFVGTSILLWCWLCMLSTAQHAEVSTDQLICADLQVCAASALLLGTNQ